MPATLPRANAHKLDLNLLRLWITLAETRNVTLAAEHLGLTQPTVSYGLAKLRLHFNDRLFVRAPQGMQPTPLGEQLAREFQQALGQIDSAVEAARHFDPATTQRSFRVAMSDIGGLYFVPPLLLHLQQAAPQAELEVKQVLLEQLADGLASGAIDAAVGNLPLPVGHTRSALLFRERYVCLFGASHHRSSNAMTLAQFQSARHVRVASPFSGHQLIEEALRAQGVARRIAVTLPHFTVLPGLIAQSDLVVTLPSRVARLFQAFGGMHIAEPPVPLPDFEVRMHWHTRHENSPPVRWFRDQIVQALTPL